MPEPPPTIAATDAVWCGAWNGGRRTSGLSAGSGRQHGGQAFGEHGLARAGRAEQRHVVAAGRRQFDGPPPPFLPHHVGEVDAGRRVDSLGGGRVEQGTVAAQEVDEPAQRVGRLDHDAGDQGRLDGVGGRDHRVAQARAHRGEDRRQHAAHRPHGAVEPELADQHRLPQRLGRHRARRGEQRQRDAEVERGAVLRQVSRQEVDREAALRPRLARVDHRRAHPVPRLGQRRVGKPGDHQAR
jgi:hypothetical protein